MSASTRYLTPDAKCLVLAEWETKKTTPRPLLELGGRGWPDPEIIPLCNALNKLPGVCTLQSCIGHPENTCDRHGNLWLWLDEAASLGFGCFGHVLARMPGIELVMKKYAEWGQEIIVVDFDGGSEEACDSILIFFTAVSAIAMRRYPND